MSPGGSLCRAPRVPVLSPWRGGWAAPLSAGSVMMFGDDVWSWQPGPPWDAQSWAQTVPCRGVPCVGLWVMGGGGGGGIYAAGEEKNPPGWGCGHNCRPPSRAGCWQPLGLSRAHEFIRGLVWGHPLEPPSLLPPHRAQEPPRWGVPWASSPLPALCQPMSPSSVCPPPPPPPCLPPRRASPLTSPQLPNLPNFTKNLPNPAMVGVGTARRGVKDKWHRVWGVCLLRGGGGGSRAVLHRGGDGGRVPPQRRPSTGPAVVKAH